MAIAIAGAGPAFAREGPAVAITREKVRNHAEGWKLAATTITLEVWSAFTFALEGFLVIEIASKDAPSSAFAIKGAAPAIAWERSEGDCTREVARVC